MEDINIDLEIFNNNLLLTQQYCSIQLLNTEKNTASILRSINPIIKEKKIFEFSLRKYYSKNENQFSFYTEWTQDPIREVGTTIFDNLFYYQDKQKKEFSNDLNSTAKYEGGILVVEIDNSITDGASEVCSNGLIDIYDCPPIDTWFYLTNNSNPRLLYSWIPKEFVFEANEAILVNCIDCIKWYKSNPLDTVNVEKFETNIYQFNNEIIEKKKYSLIEQFKNIFIKKK